MTTRFEVFASAANDLLVHAWTRLWAEPSTAGVQAEDGLALAAATADLKAVKYQPGCLAVTGQLAARQARQWALC